MIQQAPYRVSTKYEKLATDAFQIVRKAIMEELREANEYSELGIETVKATVERYYYLINYLIYIRQVVDNWFETSGESCLSADTYDKLRDTYLVDCIIKDGVCDKYTNNLVNFILKIPLCEDPFTYKWTGIGTCVNVNNQPFFERVNLAVYQSDTLVEIKEIPTGLTLEEFQSFLPDGATQALLDDRFAATTEEFCCVTPPPEAPDIEIVDVQSNQMTLSWSGSTSYIITFTDEVNGDVIVNQELTSDTSRTFTGLDVAGQYTLQVEISSCGGTTVATRTINTPPYYIQVIFCTEIAQRTKVVGVDGLLNPDFSYVYNFTVSEYGSNLDIRLEPTPNTTPPYYEVDSVTVNDVDYINNVIFDTVISSMNVGGLIELPGITEDKTVNICGSLGNPCSGVQTTYDEGTDTLTLSLI